MKLVLLMVCLFLVVGCASKYNHHATRSPSELNGMATSGNGDVVRLSGFLVHEKDSYGIWDDEAAFNEGAVSRCVTPLYGESLKSAVVSANRMTIVATGHFISDITQGDIFFYGNCSSTGIQLSDVAVIEP